MRNLKKAVTALGAVGALTLGLGVALPGAAHADYAPSSTDVVGVGSDTVQDVLDFIGDGDPYANHGFNFANNKNKLVSFDATADANVRLAYGNGGQGGTTIAGTSNVCSPGTGTGSGSDGPGAAANTSLPCTLNPTIVLRAGLHPVLRPNGSSAGIAALLNDKTVNSSKAGNWDIDFARASRPAKATGEIDTAIQNFGGAGLDSVQLGTDTLAMLANTTTNAVPLNKAQLALVYSCSGYPSGQTGWEWSNFGGSSNDNIIPIIPQLGSGTRSTFLGDIGSPTLGGCVQVGEENDPYAMNGQATPADAIEPMSGSRLDLFKGINPVTDPVNPTQAGYFRDPSCAYGSTASECTTALTPSVSFLSGTVSGTSAGVTPNNVAYTDTRGLFVYFRDADLNGSNAAHCTYTVGSGGGSGTGVAGTPTAGCANVTAFEPGGATNIGTDKLAANWIRTLFADPCPYATTSSSGASGNPDNCVLDGDGVTYDFGPFGAPYVDTTSGQQLIADAGVTPLYQLRIGS